MQNCRESTEQSSSSAITKTVQAPESRHARDPLFHQLATHVKDIFSQLPAVPQDKSCHEELLHAVTALKDAVEKRQVKGS